MKLNKSLNSVSTNITVTDDNRMEVEMNSMIYSVLSDKMYINPIQSIIREIYSNAIDANTAAGTDEPPEVHFPTPTDPVFYIRDYGVGMTAEEIVNVFGTYGKSSKRDTNEQIGGLGLGAKTPFAYKGNGGMFTVESIKNGKKSTTVFFKNSENIPCKKFIGEVDAEGSGTTVSFSVLQENFYNFFIESVVVFLFAKQFPKITGATQAWLEASNFDSFDDIEECRQLLATDFNFKKPDYYASKEEYLQNGVPYVLKIFRRNILGNFSSGIIAEMGGVPYDVEISKVFEDNKIVDMLSADRMRVLHFPIGSLDFQSSREKLNYTKNTIDLLQRALVNQEVRTICA